MNFRQTTVLIALGCVWGASFLFIKVLVDAGVAPIGVSAGRSVIGALTLAPVGFHLRHRFPYRRGPWLWLALLGGLNFALPWTLFAIAEQHAPSGAASVANSSQPLWAAMFATLLLKGERLSGLRLAGLFVGFGGVIVLMGNGLFSAGSSGSVAILVMTGATFCYGLSAVIIRRWMRDVPALPLAIGQLGFCALYLAPIALLLGDAPTLAMGARAIASLALLGGFGSGAAVVGYMWLIQQVGPVRAAVVTYLMPPIGVALGWAVLGESLGFHLAGGLVLVVVGVVVVQRPPFAALLGRLLLRDAASAVSTPIPPGD